MRQLKIIALKEFYSLFRDGRFWVCALVLWILTGLGLALSSQNIQQANAERRKAQAASRENWLSQTPKNPHKAAHFGNFAYRLKTPLSLFDSGLDSYTGTLVYLEPHKSDDFQFSSAEDATSLLRFGDLTPAFVLQTILPLLLVFLCFNAITKEKEDSTVKLLLSQGTGMRRLVAGKAAGYLAVIWLVLLPVFLVTIALLPEHLSADLWSRSLLLFCCYLVYTLVIIIISLVVSAYSNDSSSALMKLLALWIMACIILPRLAGNAGSLIYKTPSQYTHAGLVKHDELNGLNGHDPNDKRRAVLLKAQLKKYKVDTVIALPVNFDAIAMVESEKYTTSVYRKRMQEVRNLFRQQNQFTAYSAFIDPFTAIQSSSSLLSGTDFLQFTRFQDGAEDYRLYFVNVMNEFMAIHTKSGDWTTSFGKEAFAEIRPFVYREPRLYGIISAEPLTLIALIFWLLVSCLLVFTLKVKTV